jgi:hypothetical protein
MESLRESPHLERLAFEVAREIVSDDGGYGERLVFADPGSSVIDLHRGVAHMVREVVVPVMRHLLVGDGLMEPRRPRRSSESLGHSSMSFTMPTMQDAATRAIEAALGDALGGTVAESPETT